MKEESYLIGLDFGTDSVRALVTDSCGKEITTAVCAYPRWAKGLYCDAAASRFRQHPLDYLESMEKVLLEVLERIDRSKVRGIGVDTTGSTPCAVDENAVPLALQEEFASDPDAMFILWKDHTSIAESEEINSAAEKAPLDYRMYEGGNYSCEWFFSKMLHVLRRNEKVRKKAYSFVEHCDWISAVLCGCTHVKELVRTRCAAGHKALWHPSWGGLPPEEFFLSVDPLLKGMRARLFTESVPAGNKAGTISPRWAEKLSLKEDVVIATGSLDCHAGAVGAGIRKGVLVKVFGTSTCDILVSDPLKKTIPGICGQVNGSVVPGMEGLEAGQSAFGDIYGWFKRFMGHAGGSVSLEELEKAASAIAPESNSVFALDYFNGRRTPYADPTLTGSIFGMNLGTTAPMVYRALVESTCCGARRIVEHLKGQSLALDSITGVGGISRKSPFVMQTCADLLQMPIQVCASDQVCALGSAMFAATAAGIYPTVEKAMEQMRPACDRVYMPDPAKKEVYDAIYQRYLRFSEALETLR